MFLTKKLCRGKSYLYLMETVPKRGKKPARQKVVHSFGPWDEVSEEIRRQYESQNERKALAKRLEHETLLKAAQGVKLPQTAAEVADTSRRPNKGYAICYGHLALRDIWNREMGMRYKVDYLQKNTTKITEWRINDLMFYLCARKLLHPSSYLAASVSGSNFLYCPWNNVVQDNYYRLLDFVYDNKEDLLKHAVRSRLKEQKTKVEVAFFDCTNTWFETPYDDVTWAMIRFGRKTKEELEKAGFSDVEIASYLKSDQYAQEVAEYLDAEKDNIIRMRGKSKEGRYSQPIVTVALAIDQTGFPIDCKVFAGNLSEFKTIKPMLASLKQKYDVKDVYFVADRGLNSAATLDTIKSEKLGFIVAQKVSGQKAQQRKEMLDLTGYQNCTLSEDGEFRLSKDKKLKEEAFRFKVCDHVKEVYSKDGNGKGRKINLKCKIVYTYSPERKARDLAELETQIARAKQAVSAGQFMGNPYGTGWRALVKTAKEAAGKEDKEKYRANGLKEDVIAERKTIAGYAAVVYDHPKDLPEEKMFAGHAILTKYHELVQIEDSFRVMKSSFDIRPMHVRLHDRIVAHCYLCVFALMMLRSVQEKLSKAGTPMSSDTIIDALSQALVMPTAAEQPEDIKFVNMGLDPEFHGLDICPKGRREAGINEVHNSDLVWKTYEAKMEEEPDKTDKIFLACGLQPLMFCNTMGDVKIRMGLKSVPVNHMLAPEFIRLMQKIAATSG